MITKVSCPFCMADLNLDLRATGVEEATSVIPCPNCHKRMVLTYKLEMRVSTSKVLDIEVLQ